MKLVRWALQHSYRLIVPTVVVAEAHRERVHRSLIDAMDICPLDRVIAESAGLALAATNPSGRMTIDAVVMATAAQLGCNVYSGDVDDLRRFEDYFRAVKVFGINEE